MISASTQDAHSIATPKFSVMWHTARWKSGNSTHSLLALLCMLEHKPMSAEHKSICSPFLTECILSVQGYAGMKNFLKSFLPIPLRWVAPYVVRGRVSTAVNSQVRSPTCPGSLNSKATKVILISVNSLSLSFDLSLWAIAGNMILYFFQFCKNTAEPELLSIKVCRKSEP